METEGSTNLIVVQDNARKSTSAPHGTALDINVSISYNTVFSSFILLGATESSCLIFINLNSHISIGFQVSSRTN